MLYKNLKKLRQEYDISAARIAKFLQVSEQDIIDWEAGVRKPTLHQIHQLADLFDISYNELMDDELKMSSNSSSSQNVTKSKRGKRKSKKKTKHKQKNKKVNKKKVEKHQNWPLLVILVILLCALGVGGFIYWKYGDEYSLIKKKAYTVDEMVGTFQIESGNYDILPTLTLLSDETFTLTTTCTVDGVVRGNWNVENTTLTLTSDREIIYTLKINSTNKLNFTSDTTDCTPVKNDIFTRGTSGETSTSQEPKEDTNSDSSYEEETNESDIVIGTYLATNTTLQISYVDTSKAIFTLQSIDASDSSLIAELTSITGAVNGNTLSFVFDDDGFGNAGEGKMVFDGANVVFNITFTSKNEEAKSSIITSGSLMR